MQAIRTRKRSGCSAPATSVEMDAAQITMLTAGDYPSCLAKHANLLQTEQFRGGARTPLYWQSDR
jgi:hypothetical protein